MMACTMHIEYIGPQYWISSLFMLLSLIMFLKSSQLSEPTFRQSNHTISHHHIQFQRILTSFVVFAINTIIQANDSFHLYSCIACYIDAKCRHIGLFISIHAKNEYLLAFPNNRNFWLFFGFRCNFAAKSDQAAFRRYMNFTLHKPKVNDSKGAKKSQNG